MLQLEGPRTAEGHRSNAPEGRSRAGERVRHGAIHIAQSKFALLAMALLSTPGAVEAERIYDCLLNDGDSHTGSATTTGYICHILADLCLGQMGRTAFATSTRSRNALAFPVSPDLVRVPRN